MLASGCADEAAAARVGDTTISNEDLMAEAETLADNERLLGVLQQMELSAIQGEADADESYTQGFIGSLLNQRIGTILIEQALDERDAGLTQDDLDETEDRLSSALAGAGLSEDDLTDDLREQLIHSLALNRRLTEEFGDGEEAGQEIEAAIFEQARQTDIEISSKYGSWDLNRLSIVPPPGPVPAEGEGDDAEAQP